MNNLEKLLRGVDEVITLEEFKNLLSQNRQLRIKFGIDPTASDIHLGHTVILRKLKQFQDAGHLIIFIVGDFTASIGDPSGRSEIRKVLSPQEIAKNAKTYQEQVFKILDKQKTQILYNSSWLSKLGVEGIFDLCSRYTVARMLERNDFQKRYSNGYPITILEFIYPLIQGYDSVEVKADIEIGGTDQKFNLLVGRELQKEFNQSPQVVITMPLLVGTDGVRKMSKSYNNYIGITEEPKEIYGKIMSISDSLMLDYYKLLTDFNLEEIEKMQPRDAKSKLAFYIVSQYYSEKVALNAQEEFEKIFKKKEAPEQIEEIKVKVKEIDILQLLLEAKLAESKSDAKRLVLQGAVKINDEKITKVKPLKIDQPLIIKVGKRKFKKIIPDEKI